MRLKLLSVVFALISGAVVSQDLSSYYSYIVNPSNINPAYVGSTENIQGILDSRSQFSGVKGSPKNIMFGLNAPVFTNQGAGLRLISDSRGAFEVTRVDVTYAHGFQLKQDVSLRFGLSVGMLSRKLDMNNVDNKSNSFDENDPTASGEAFNSNNFASGFGLLLDWSGVKVGFSAPHIIENGADLNQFLTGSLSYKYILDGGKWAVEPTVMYQNVPVSPNILDVWVKGEWNEKLQMILGYANNNRIKAGVGFDLKGFGATYIYEHSTGDLKSLSASTHEIVLNISIRKKTKDNKTSPESSTMEGELDNMIDHVTRLNEGGATKDKEYILSEIKSIRKQLNDVLDQNTEENAMKMANKLNKLEEQINILISKYKL